jgi:adenosylcobyric acid synthase
MLNKVWQRRLELNQMAKSIMFVGTASDAGKSTLCTAICRILHQDGHLVAPFKAQNMSLNSAATPSGREIGRAQAVQAEACGIPPNEHMNPVLLKPTSYTSSQVIVQGRVYDTRSAREYFLDDKEELWRLVMESYQFLSERHEIMVIEGAGSPVEMNLKSRDIVNMRVANLADAVVILVADIERGGVFASVVGTLQLLPSEERARVKGIVINKFRGDPTLFADGKQWLEDYTGVPILGVLPYIQNMNIDEEDALGIDSRRYQKVRENRGRIPNSDGRDVSEWRVEPEGSMGHGLREERPGRGQGDAPGRAQESEDGGQVQDGENDGQTYIRIAIIQLPHISNFTDFDPLFLEPGVEAYFCQDPRDLAGAHALILPGTKNTIADLNWLKEAGFARALAGMETGNIFLFGICGGYQMLGKKIYDEHHYESSLSECDGLGVFDAATALHGEKRTVLVKGKLDNDFSGLEVEGYEIHMGVTEHSGEQRPFARICEWGSDTGSNLGSNPDSYTNNLNPNLGSNSDSDSDSASSSDTGSDKFIEEGHVSPNGRYIGTYLHGILHNDQFRTMWLNRIRSANGIPAAEEAISMTEIRANAFDRLAEITRQYLDIDSLYRMLDLK